jgi:OmpA family/PEGA domain
MNTKSYVWVVIAGVLLFATAGFAKDSKLRVHVQPRQAYIFVDGVPFGDGGRTVKVAAGKHIVGVYNYGFAPQVREVSAEAGTVTGVDFTLQPVAGETKGPWGRIQIESATRSAVLLNGKTPEYFVGHGDEFNHGGAFLPCCVQQLVVPAGTYLVTILEKGGQEVWSGTVNVAPNERVIINAANGKQKVKPWHQGETIASLPRFKAGTASANTAVAPVSGSLVAQSANINCGDSTNLSWTSPESVERAITVGAENSKQPTETGELSVAPKQTTTYDLHASGPGGTASASTTVNVNTVVQSSLQASPSEVHYRRIGDKVLKQESSNLTWSASNAHAVSIEPLGSVKTNDSQSVTPAPSQQSEGTVNEVKTYTLTATNECGGSDTQTASIRVVGSIEPIPAVPLASVFFPTGHPDQRHPEAGLVWSQQKVLDQTAEGFKKYLEYDPQARLTVLGNTDERDSNARNKPLSERRANRVKQYLVSLGVPESNIDTIAQGKEHPLDASTVKLLHEQNPNKPAKSLGSFRDLVWAYNRRVDLVLQPKGEQSAQYLPGNASEAKLLFRSEWPEHPQIVILAAEKESLPVVPDPQQK